MIGGTMLMALVTKNAIMMVHFVNCARRAGAKLEDALLQAGRMRLRPILMTTDAMLGGMRGRACAGRLRRRVAGIGCADNTRAGPWDNPGMDIERARFNMVEQQIRTWEVLDQEVLDLLFVLKREDFVPAAYRMLAFADLEIPLGNGARMWTPKLEARVLQELRLRRGEHVLEIGTGSGYFTALLHARGAQVTSVEIDPRLAEEARAKLARFDIGPVELAAGDGARGWGSDGYDAIVLTGSVPVLPDAFLRQLKPGGRVFAVIGEAPVMTARMTHWVAEGSYAVEDLFETVIEPLLHAPAPSRFEF